MHKHWWDFPGYSRISGFRICVPTAWNESHWYLVTIQSVTIFDLQVKNIDFQFSPKSGASGIFLFENITFNGQIWCFMTVSGILNRNCCSTVVCETNFVSPISQNGTLYSSQIDLSITFEPVGRSAYFWKENECSSLQVCKNQSFMKSTNVTRFGG